MALGTGVASLVCVALLCPFLTDKSRYFPAFPLGWPPAGLPGPLPLPCPGPAMARLRRLWVFSASWTTRHS